jgi:hypothetical protein
VVLMHAQKVVALTIEEITANQVVLVQANQKQVVLVVEHNF